jgi:hypothetical protein
MPAAKSRLVSFIQKPPWGRASLSALLGVGGVLAVSGIRENRVLFKDSRARSKLISQRFRLTANANPTVSINAGGQA